jgi:hypothetical protein
MADLDLAGKWVFQKGIAIPVGGSISFKGGTAGFRSIDNKINVAGSDVSLNLGSLSAIGSFFVLNLANESVPEAAGVVITQAGTPGSTADSYVVVFHYPDGSLSITTADTSTANATLNGSNYNILTWTTPASASSVDVYRMVAGGSPSTLGLLTAGATSPYHDTGIAGDGSAQPSLITSKFPLEFGPTSGDYPLLIEAGRWSEGQWNAAAMHFKATGPLVSDINLQYILVEP